MMEDTSPERRADDRQHRTIHSLMRARAGEPTLKDPAVVDAVVECGWIELLPSALVTADLLVRQAGRTEPLVFAAARTQSIRAAAHAITPEIAALRGADGRTLMEVCARNGTLGDMGLPAIPREHFGPILVTAAEAGMIDKLPFRPTPEQLAKPTSDGRTCYHYAAMAGKLDSLPPGSWTPDAWNAKDAFGDTPLHLYLRTLACKPRHERQAAVERLASHGVDGVNVRWDVPNKADEYALDIAERLKVDPGTFPPKSQLRPSKTALFAIGALEYENHAPEIRMKEGLKQLVHGVRPPTSIRRDHLPSEHTYDQQMDFAGRRSTHLAMMHRNPELIGETRWKFKDDFLRQDGFGDTPLHVFLKHASPAEAASFRLYHREAWTDPWFVRNHAGVQPVDLMIDLGCGGDLPLAVQKKIEGERGLHIYPRMPVGDARRILDRTLITEPETLRPPAKTPERNQEHPRLL